MRAPTICGFCRPGTTHEIVTLLAILDVTLGALPTSVFASFVVVVVLRVSVLRVSSDIGERISLGHWPPSILAPQHQPEVHVSIGTLSLDCRVLDFLGLVYTRCRRRYIANPG